MHSIVSEISCPYCGEPLKYSADIARCSICRTPHHLACWEQHESCSVRGCNGKPSVVRFSQKEKAPYLRILLPVLIVTVLSVLDLLLR